MGAKSLVPLVYALTILSVAFAELSVPLLMWRKSGELPVSADASKSCKVPADDFEVKVLESLDKIDNVLLFLQDTLSIEDFSKYGKAAYGNLSPVFGGDGSNHLFLPRVWDAAGACQEALGRTRKISEINEVADGQRIATLFRASPRNLIIIKLKTTGGGRMDKLIEKDEQIKKFVDAAAARSDNWVAVLTGERSSVSGDVKRLRREADEKVRLDGECVDVDAKSVTVELGAKSAGGNKSVVKLPGQLARSEDDSDCAKKTGSRSASFALSTDENPNLSELKLTFDFMFKDDSSWELPKLTASYKDEDGVMQTEELRRSQTIVGKEGKPYVGAIRVRFESKDKKVAVTFDNLKINPYGAKDEPARAKVRAVNDTPSGNQYFSIPILSAMTVSFLFIIIMAWALDNITSIKTMDQFDDPRGKTITVPVTD